jgi:dTDP-3-amino-2,3,6-trideoxy-4-keto-D-glucose/dTDP-3-amino-3,4,6-trideoxy-alpha-D-glucose/dTDP-2,6-dideoxy-D-kanosamine transaminase
MGRTTVLSEPIRLFCIPVPIPVWDYRAEYEAERDDTLAAVDQVLRSGRLILGESVRAFEQELAAYCGARYGVGVNSGTDALALALRALDLRPGDEVITTSNTAIPTVSAIVAAGGCPRFIDIEADTGLMDVSRLESAITPRTRAIVPVHLFGQCVDMDAVDEIVNRRAIRVIEDCAQSTGAEFRGRRAGSMSHAAAHSFYPTKILGGYGDGGMVVTSDQALAARVRRLRVYGTDGTYYAEEHGCNSRLDELQAEILRRKLRRIDYYVERRVALARRYDEQLRDTGLGLPVTRPGNRHVFHLYVVRHPARQAILAALAEQGITVGIHYPWPVHTMRAYAHFGGGEGSLPVTEQAAQEIFSLPMFPSLTDGDQDQVCEALRVSLQSESRKVLS